MRLTFHDSQIAVVDDALAPDVFGMLWSHLQTLRYEPVQSDHIRGVWRLLDGNPFKGPLAVLLAEDEANRPEAQTLRKQGRLLFPTGTLLDAVLQAVTAAPPEARRLVGEQGKDWFELNARPWIYPVGTRLSWHDDASTYCGAFVYYAHPSWNALWGGELLVAHEGVRDRMRGTNTSFAPDDALQLDNQAENDELMREGHGRFVAAKPNRLVFLGAGVSHMVAQVHAAAGDHPRVTVSGFFLRKPRTGAETLDYSSALSQRLEPSTG
jgi:hypothetical protein